MSKRARERTPNPVAGARVTEDEMRLIDAAAALKGQNRTDWLRDLMLKAATRQLRRAGVQVGPT